MREREEPKMTAKVWEHAPFSHWDHFIDDRLPHIRGISDDKGRLMVLMTHNSDYGDAWEWADDPDYPAEMTTYAYRLGVNSIIYAMTH
jgi:hypothetical protein